MSHHVLVVDDDEIVRTGLAANLERDGYRVSTAAGADDALRAMERAPADLVLTDLVMEGMDGLALLRRIAAQSPDVPVIVLTGHGTAASAIEALRAGAADYLLKPVRPEEITHRIRTVLDAREMKGRLLKERNRFQAQRRERDRREGRRDRHAALELFGAGLASDLRAALEEPGGARLRELAARLDRWSGGATEPAPLDLNRVLEEYLESEQFAALRDRHAHRRVESRLVRPLAPALGAADGADALRRLVELAVRVATESPVAVRTGMERVADADGAERPYAVVSVQFGAAVRPEDAERLFEPYYACRALGWPVGAFDLAAVQALARRSGGFADAYATGEGRRLEVAVRLPFAEPGTGDASAPLRSRGVERVLVVDDSEAHRNEARRMLEELGYAVSLAENGGAAIAWAEERGRKGEPPADLMLIDLVLGDAVDGVETFRRARAIHPRQKAVLVGGFVETERVLRALDDGVAQYLRKPFSIEALGRAVRAALDGD